MDSVDSLYRAGHSHLCRVQQHVTAAGGFDGLSDTDRESVRYHLQQARSILELVSTQAHDSETFAEIEDVLYRIDTHLCTVS